MTGKVDIDSIHKNWRTLYLAAIGEEDKNLLAKRISDAEHAMFLRERELFYIGITLEEKEALEDALYALRALESARAHADRRVKLRLGP
jgi:capsule polysaccharide export protein KpsE/RkpR